MLTGFALCDKKSGEVAGEPMSGKVKPMSLWSSAGFGRGSQAQTHDVGRISQGELHTSGCGPKHRPGATPPADLLRRRNDTAHLHEHADAFAQPAALVVCSDLADRATYAAWVRSEGFMVVEASSSSEALAYQRQRSFSLAVCELTSPHVDGIQLIRAMRATSPGTKVLTLLSGNDPAQAKVAALQAGSAGLLLKPLDQQAIHRHIRRIKGVLGGDQPGLELRRRYDFSRIIGDSPLMLSVLALAARVAAHNSPVLITGESGTGKELLANAIHDNSARADRRMVSVNCAAIPEPLLESELFGYRRGAFTGAVKDKPGLLTVADGGTLFLDEVTELPFATQAKLLRFLQDGQYFPLGAVRPHTADVRILAATNASLIDRIANRTFRRDLYYRLAVFPLNIPPLREHPQDIVPLAQHFLVQLASEFGRNVPGLSREAVSYLTAQSWCGNVRELRNAIERAVIISNGNLLTSADFRALEPGIENGDRLDRGLGVLPEEGIDLTELNRTLIAAALVRKGFNVSAAARLLGITRPALRHRMRKYGLARGENRSLPFLRE